MFVIQKIRAYGLALAVLTLPLSVFHAQAEEARIWSSQDSIDAPSDALLETQSVPQTGPSDFWLGETGTTICRPRQHPNAPWPNPRVISMR
jgi:hypothetical protein